MANIFVVFTACMLHSTTPACVEKEIGLDVDEVDVQAEQIMPSRCMQIAQTTIANWSSEEYDHYGRVWKIDRFKCETANRHLKHKKQDI